MPSRFLRALPPELLEERRTTSLWSPTSAFDGFGARGSVPRSGSRFGSRPRSQPAAASYIPDAADEDASQAAPRYIKGERIRHRRFGTGTIQGLSGAGRDLKVAVAFDDEEVGLKQLLVAYAGLERDLEGA
jgi:DNA helicase-2/ATP-dependent DNA helicase PcrA